MRMLTTAARICPALLLVLIVVTTSHRGDAAEPRKRLWSPAYIGRACPTTTISLGESFDLLAKAGRRNPEERNPLYREATYFRQLATFIDATCDQAMTLARPQGPRCPTFDGKWGRDKFDSWVASYLKWLETNGASLADNVAQSAPGRPGENQRIHAASEILLAFQQSVSLLVKKGTEIDYATASNCSGVTYPDTQANRDRIEDIMDDRKAAFAALEPTVAVAKAKLDEFLALCSTAEEAYSATAFALLPPEEQARRKQQLADQQAANEAQALRAKQRQEEAEKQAQVAAAAAEKERRAQEEARKAKPKDKDIADVRGLPWGASPQTALSKFPALKKVDVEKPLRARQQMLAMTDDIRGYSASVLLLFLDQRLQKVIISIPYEGNEDLEAKLAALLDGIGSKYGSYTDGSYDPKELAATRFRWKRASASVFVQVFSSDAMQSVTASYETPVWTKYVRAKNAAEIDSKL